MNEYVSAAAYENLYNNGFVLYLGSITIEDFCRCSCQHDTDVNQVGYDGKSLCEKNLTLNYHMDEA